MSKRGRPALLSQEHLQSLVGIFTEITTKRGLQDKYYEIRAYSVLKDLDNVEFIVDMTKKPEVYKAGIVRELGRLNCDEDIGVVAKHICKRAENEKRTIRQWSTIIKSIRYLRCLISELLTSGN